MRERANGLLLNLAPPPSLSSSLTRRVHTIWFQYLITLAPYCFDWWERLLVHALVAGGLALVVYGGMLAARAASLLMAVAVRGPA